MKKISLHKQEPFYHLVRLWKLFNYQNKTLKSISLKITKPLYKMGYLDYLIYEVHDACQPCIISLNLYVLFVKIFQYRGKSLLDQIHFVISFYRNTIQNGGWTIHGGNNDPLRGGKTTLFEGGTRATAFVSGAGIQKSTYVYPGSVYI